MRRQLLIQLLLLALLFYAFIILCAAHAKQMRYSFPWVPLTLVWTAQALQTIYRWTRDTLERALGFAYSLNFLTALPVAAILIILMAISTVGARQVPEFEMSHARHALVRSAGLWLKEQAPGPKTILSEAAVFPLYSGGFQVLFPSAPPETVLRYLHSENPDFVVLGNSPVRFAPYLKEWYDHGIPDAQAHLIYAAEDPQGEGLRVYSWGWTKPLMPAIQRP